MLLFRGLRSLTFADDMQVLGFVIYYIPHSSRLPSIAATPQRIEKINVKDNRT